MKADMTGADESGERIAKRIARAGICSRRDAERLIADGRVSVDGKRLDSPAFVVTEGMRITVDGQPLPALEPPRLWRCHKPAGLVTTHRDPQGRPTLFERLPENLPRVISVGRLDLTSEGLILLTNDGELARRLELPSTGWVRRYRVRVHGTVDNAMLEALGRGVEIDGVRYGPVEALFDREQGANAWLTMGLREGKNREVRRLCEHLGLTVTRLIRIAYGPFQLGLLPPLGVEEVPRRVLKDQVAGAARADAARTTEERPRPAGKTFAKPARARTDAARATEERPRPAGKTFTKPARARSDAARATEERPRPAGKTFAKPARARTDAARTTEERPRPAGKTFAKSARTRTDAAHAAEERPRPAGKTFAKPARARSDAAHGAEERPRPPGGKVISGAPWSRGRLSAKETIELAERRAAAGATGAQGTGTQGTGTQGTGAQRTGARGGKSPAAKPAGFKPGSRTPPAGAPAGPGRGKSHASRRRQPKG